MLSCVNKLHMLIVSLGGKRKERLNKIKFYIVHSRKNNNFIFSANVQCETFWSLPGSFSPELAGLHLQAPALPSSQPGKKPKVKLVSQVPGTMPNYPLGEVPS